MITPRNGGRDYHGIRGKQPRRLSSEVEHTAHHSERLKGSVIW